MTIEISTATGACSISRAISIMRRWPACSGLNAPGKMAALAVPPWPTKSTLPNRSDPPGERGHGLAVLDVLAFEQLQRHAVLHVARRGHGVQHQSAGEPLLVEPAAAVLQQFERPGGGAGGRLHGHVDAMLAPLRMIGGQAGRAGHAGRRRLGLVVGHGPAEGAHGHGPGGRRRTGLVGPPPQPGDQCLLRVGHDGFQHRPRGAGHFQQIGNRPTAAARNRRHHPRGGIVNALNELFTGQSIA